MSGPPHDRTFRDSSTSSSGPGERHAPARPVRAVAPPPMRAASPARPGVVTASFWLWVAGFAVGLALVAYSLHEFDAVHRQLVDTVRARQPDIDGELLGRAVDMTLYIGLGGITALALVQLLLAVLMRARRNRARIALAVTAALALAGALLALVAVAEQARAALPLQALLIVVAAVLMFLPGANAWFRRRSA